MRRIFVRFAITGPLGLLALGLYAQAAVAVILAPSGAQAILWALVGLGAVFAASYLWQRWWVSAPATAIIGLIVTLLAGGQLHSPLVVTALFSALVGWWSKKRLTWPLRPAEAFLAIGVLVMVSLSLSAMLATRGAPLNTQAPQALAVLYLSTPPWEWIVVLAVLSQSRHLRLFLAENYARGNFLRHAGIGLAAGIGMLVVTAAVVSAESHGLKVHVRANNPFVFAPSLSRHRTLAQALIAGAVVVLAPLGEEALFRGVLFSSLSSRWGYAIGTVTSAAVFGLAHLDLSLLLPLGVAGLVLNELYRRTGSLVTSTVAHATLNGLAVFSALGATGVIHL